MIISAGGLYTVRHHATYGPVVRISPNEASLTSADTAWPDLYGFRTGRLAGTQNNPKDPAWYPSAANGVPSIGLADDVDHSKRRRVLSHAFSERALAEQEPLIQKYVDQLVDRLAEHASSRSAPVDLTKWYNWITFDTVADLIFGAPFGCLRISRPINFRFFYIMTYYPVMQYVAGLLVNKEMIRKRIEYADWVWNQRMDFMTHVLRHNGEKGYTMGKEQMDSNALLLLTAGSETIATLLSACTYLLLTNPDKLDKLKHAVRGTWHTYDQITLAEVNNLPYLLAVLNEALRLFPSVPMGFGRKIASEGAQFSGHWLPGSTGASISQYAAYHSRENFKNPDEYIPERTSRMLR
ncbi:hypothetical protein CERZMDRAFT_108242 [Cercospora zeae-maydis SCOH1-5]|uniref:Uncharacterized protein n=1 Tax=Cercospora zeae-maydis SCOH1-5 TaxID=717836 RepID=A0A6A6FVR2_9PEZI|nr:hypothetical protein CERZMDRAFT_108242 [Cercospora zeae-maydis SCOH1-5]